jgi:predicted nucleic acid-binding protein
MTKVYVDTGVFIDYLSPLALGGAGLRRAPRRGRSPQALSADAAALLTKIAAAHCGATSCLAYFETEEALHRVWRASTKGRAHSSLICALAARSIVPQVALAIHFFKLQELALTPAIVARQFALPILHAQGIRAGDALHICTALDFGADVIVSADDDLLQLDQQLSNAHGTMIRCVDTDRALALL